jgi:hypothetical protein
MAHEIAGGPEQCFGEAEQDVWVDAQDDLGERATNRRLDVLGLDGDAADPAVGGPVDVRHGFAVWAPRRVVLSGVLGGPLGVGQQLDAPPSPSPRLDVSGGVGPRAGVGRVVGVRGR